MKKLIILLLISNCGKTILAQSVKTTVLTNEKGEKITEVKISGLGIHGFQEGKRLYRGTILFNENFEMATIKLKGGQPMDTPILFNLYKDELVAKLEGKEVLFTNTDFSIRGQNFISIKGHYYQLLFENDKVKVLKRYHCVMHTNRSRGGLNMGGIYEGDFITNEEFFFLFPDDKMREFKVEKISVLSVLEKRNAFLAYPFNDDTLKINKVEDVIALLK
jgi:hypothetical protein